MFQAIGGIPANLMINEQIAHMVAPLVDQLQLNVQTDRYESIARIAVEEMENMLPF